ncbi:MAG TPA: hypothetical protein VFA76_02185 [Terriglobales bacterium]|nr:hypothetical protein [Terriglobales bacterium]
MRIQACAFCGRAGERSKEDAIPRWLQKMLNISHGQLETLRYKIEREPMIKLRRLAHRSLQVRSLLAGRICRACNTGWMSRLENEAKPLLCRLLISESPYCLTGVEKAILARWAVKTAFVLDIMAIERHIVPPEHFREFYEDQNRLADHLIVLAGDHLPSKNFGWIARAGWQLIGPQAEVESNIPRVRGSQHKTVMQLGALLLLVATWSIADWIPSLNEMWQAPLWIAQRHFLHSSSNAVNAQGSRAAIYSFANELIAVAPSIAGDPDQIRVPPFVRFRLAS